MKKILIFISLFGSALILQSCAVYPYGSPYNGYQPGYYGGGHHGWGGGQRWNGGGYGRGGHHGWGHD